MNSATNEIYGSLLKEAQPHIIENDDDNQRCIALLETLLNKRKLSREQKKLADLLTLLIEDYEKQFTIEPGASPADIVRHLTSANDLKPIDMLDIFGGKSTVSMILSGQRPLSKLHIERLSERFQVSPEVFFPRKQSQRAS